MFAIIAAYLSKLKINKILKSIQKIKPINGRLENIGNLKNNSKRLFLIMRTLQMLYKL